MQHIPEGNLDFGFADEWHVVKFDETAYYRTLLETINGVKAVDFVATTTTLVAATGAPGERLLLLEVKDFRENNDELQAKIETEEFPLEVVQKTLHTISGLYLLTRPDVARRPEAALLRPYADAVRTGPAVLEVVLFLEQPPVKYSPRDKAYKLGIANRDAQRSGIRKRLVEKLRPLGFACQLFDTTTQPNTAATLGWTATHRPTT